MPEATGAYSAGDDVREGPENAIPALKSQDISRNTQADETAKPALETAALETPSAEEVARRLAFIGEMQPGQDWPDFLGGTGFHSNWGPPLSALCKRAAELVNEAIETDETFELRWNADVRAIARWQKEHPGNDHVWPDHADLVVWLMEQLEAAPAVTITDPGHSSLARHDRALPAPVHEVIDRMLFDALVGAGRSALGMPGTVDTFKEWLERAGLKVVLA